MRDAFFEQHELGGVEDPVLDGERFFPGLAGHVVNFLTVHCRFIETAWLAQFPSNLMNQSVRMDAVLKSFGPPKIGRFDATATIRLFIY